MAANHLATLVSTIQYQTLSIIWLDYTFLCDTYIALLLHFAFRGQTDQSEELKQASRASAEFKFIKQQ